MKKRLSVLITAACAVIALSSCGNADSEAVTVPTATAASSVTTTVTSAPAEAVTTTTTTTNQTTTTAAAPGEDVTDTSSETTTSASETEAPKETEKPAVTTTAPKTTKAAQTVTKKGTTAHTHNWVKQWDDGNGTILYWCPGCLTDRYEHYTVTATTTTTTAAPKPSHQHDWKPIYAVDWTGHYRCHCGLLTDAAIDGKGADHDKAYAEEQAHQKVDVETFQNGQIQWTVSAGYDNSGTCGHKSSSVFFYYCSKCSAVCYPDWGTQDQEEGKIAHPGTEIFDSIPDWWDLNVSYYWLKDTPFEKSADFINPMYGVKFRYVKHKGEWVLIYEDSFFADTPK